MNTYLIAVYTIFLRELRILRNCLGRQIVSMSVSPILYLVAFGYGLDKTQKINGVPYAIWLLPGLIAMSTMSHAYAIASEINITRFYYHIFDELQSAPIPPTAIALGEVLAGITRALLAATIILALALTCNIVLIPSLLLPAAILLNAAVFASLAVIIALIVHSHQDQALLTTLVITPMAFLGSTFFPIDHLPTIPKVILTYLPITNASIAIRAAYLRQPTPVEAYAMLIGYIIVFFWLACFCVGRVQE